MQKQPITFQPIGVITTPHKKQKGTPIQPYAARDVAGEVHVFPEYRDGLKDLGGFERVWLIYHLHRASSAKLSVIPYRDVVERGLFATRAPCRPNAIGLSAVRVLELDVKSGILKILDVDMLDQTPLLDIKPYVPRFDSYQNSKAGWLDDLGEDRDIADDRFPIR
ncbi:tRNA (N6-threonylcarbamoyladenosine(37)-N6)-methyltransferase TrmO [candidate division LCP-89 bacterium B3_LCP]|uniref:tRNA (N6-threonylcarbamoyladenosine(37)-N6)-methyltransferase TrmO n=1 Tax=candidate division LCP-89 bacterium B3_LCP TaxID=2012998 RepID=A0A532UQR8_UNCL8|nr:MAG: tRNA (N6-threonylcarbamoyladenosine(37)-N6)-methyltransferase TrmO [candidate division LCP-89 bacterium B3_LCP]